MTLQNRETSPRSCKDKLKDMLSFRAMRNNPKIRNLVFDTSFGLPLRWLWALLRISNTRWRIESVEKQLKIMSEQMGMLKADSLFLTYLTTEERSIFLNTSDPVRYGAIKLAIDRINNRNIPGAFAEAGVYQGYTSKIIHMLAPDRSLFLFDTFEGFPDKDLGGRIDNRFKETNIDIVKEVIGNMDNVHIMEGYFPETTVGLENEIFAFVMLDLDLYAPTLAGLKFFYPRMSPRGYIFIHDYADGWEAHRAVNDFMADKREGIVYIPDT